VITHSFEVTDNYLIKIMRDLSLLFLVAPLSYQIMNTLLNKIKLLETTELNTVILKCGPWGIHPDLLYPRKNPSF